VTATKPETPEQRRKRLSDEAKARAAEQKRLSAEWEREHNAGPGVTMVCGQALVSPKARPDLPDDLWAELLELQARGGDPSDFIARAEAHMGTTDLHRIDAKERAGMFSPAEADEARRTLRARISAEKRRQLLDENRRAASLDAPLRDPSFVQAIAKAEGKLLTAQKELEELRAGDPKKNRKAIKRAENQVRSLAEEVAKLQTIEREAYEAMGEAREPLLRALQRGEFVQAKVAETADFARGEHGERIINRGGPMRGLPALVYSRGLRAKKLTGIQHAYAKGYLGAGTEAERRYQTGCHYGEAYEIVMGMTSTNGEGGGGFGPKGPQPRVIEAGQDFRDFRAALTERQKDALDQVCGRGLRVGQAAAAMRADVRTVERLLVSGLDAAGHSLAAERAKRAGRMDEAA